MKGCCDDKISKSKTEGVQSHCLCVDLLHGVSCRFLTPPASALRNLPKKEKKKLVEQGVAQYKEDPWIP